MENKSKKNGSVSEILGKPVFCGFDEKTQKVKTILIFLSVVGIVFSIYSLEIAQESTFLGLKFDGLENIIFKNTLLAITVYFTLTFLWYSIDSFLEWRLRITGTKTAFVTTGKLASKDGDYPDDPRQSTLYNWWKERSKSVAEINQKIKIIENTIFKIENLLDTKSIPSNEVNFDKRISTEIKEIKESLTSIDRKIINTNEIIESDRVFISLKRFDNWFKIFINSQNIRWLILDFLTPLTLALMAIFYLGF